MNEGIENRSEKKLRIRSDDELAQNPYHADTPQMGVFHAVCVDRYDHTVFINAATIEALNEGVSDLTRIKRVVAVYEGKLRDFSEKREVRLGE